MSTIKVTNLRHESATGDNITLTSTDRVGIGTSSPAVTVHAEDAQCELQLKSTSGTNSAGLRFVPGGETNALYIYADGSRNINIDNHATSIASFRAGGGLTFNGDTAAANALDDYEEGTWTPELADANTGGNTVTHEVQNGLYTKVGNVVTIYFRVTWTSKASASGTVRLRGLPFTSKSNSGQYYYVGSTINNNGQVSVAVTGNGANAIFYDSSGGAGTFAELSSSDTGNGMNGTVTYLAA